ATQTAVTKLLKKIKTKETAMNELARTITETDDKIEIRIKSLNIKIEATREYAIHLLAVLRKYYVWGSLFEEGGTRRKIDADYSTAFKNPASIWTKLSPKNLFSDDTIAKCFTEFSWIQAKLQQKYKE